MPNTISFENYPELRQRFFDLLSLSTADTNTAERLGSLLCCLPDVPMPEGSATRTSSASRSCSSSTASISASATSSAPASIS